MPDLYLDWMLRDAALPQFTDWEGHGKLTPLEGPGSEPEPFVRQWLAEQTSRLGHSPRVLDLGCGKGNTVAWLCEAGYDAYGVDVSRSYVANGLGYFRAQGLGERLFTVGPDGSYPFPDGRFDAVLSDQVFEHVADLPSLAREVYRVLRPGGMGLHVFPAKWRIIEPHMLTPMAHWMPKGRARRVAIAAALRMGRAVPHFSESHSLRERTKIFSTFSEEETYYRAPREIARILREHGLQPSFLPVAARKLAVRFPRLPRPMLPAAAYVHQTFQAVYLTTQRGDR